MADADESAGESPAADAKNVERARDADRNRNRNQNQNQNRVQIQFRRFELVRRKDPTGVSGTGVVARGIEFPSGTAVLEWDATNADINAENGLAIKPAPDGVDAILEVHGHDGATQINWLDGAESPD